MVNPTSSQEIYLASHSSSVELLELFISLDATDEQLNYPIIYASAREGWAKEEVEAQSETIFPLLDKILSHVPPPNVDRSTPFSMLITVSNFR